MGVMRLLTTDAAPAPAAVTLVLYMLPGHCPYHVHDSALVSLWGCWQSVCFDRRSCTVVVCTPTVYPLLPRIGEGNRLHAAGAPTSPLSVVGLANSLQGCQPWPVTC